MLLPDYPIDKKENDLLKRSPLARKIAEMIGKFDGKESFVIGIEGSWGAGKTSFVNMALDELSTEEVIIVNFNPWNFSGQNELIEDFFDSLATAIKPFQKDEDDLKKLKRMSHKLMRKSEASFSPELTFLGGLIKFTATDLFKLSGKEKSLQEMRKDLDSVFKSLGKKVVIVIDDIDRLDKNETRLVMKLVKMTANFPHTVFLLAYDRVHVARRLEEDGWPGDEFLKKIVQVSFTLPVPDHTEMRKILFSDLDETIENLYGKFKIEGENEKRWNQIVYAGFPVLFNTIRDMKRYISSLRLNWSIVNIDDVNMIDFLTIEAIRVFFPRFHSIISANKAFFLATHGVYVSMSYHDDQPKRKKIFEEMLDEAEIKNTKDRQIVTKICQELFPQLENQNYGVDWQVIWRNEQRICSDTSFDVYFQLGIPSGRVPESEVKEVIKLLDNKDAFSDELINLVKEKRIRPILSRITDQLERIKESQLRNLVLSLWDLEGKIIDEKTAVFDFDDFNSNTRRITYHALRNLKTRLSRKEFLDKLINATNAIYNPLIIIRHIEEDIEKGKQGEDLLLDQKDLEYSKKVLMGRIQKSANEGKLIKTQSLPFVLFTWKKWAGDEPVKAYVSDLLKKKDGVLAFIDGFVGMTYSSNGNYKDINKKNIGELYPLDEVETIVNKLTKEDLAKATESEREAIKVFKNPPRRW